MAEWRTFPTQAPCKTTFFALGLLLASPRQFFSGWSDAGIKKTLMQKRKQSSLRNRSLTTDNNNRTQMETSALVLGAIALVAVSFVGGAIVMGSWIVYKTTKRM